MPVAEPNVTGQLLVIAGPVVADAVEPPVDLVAPVAEELTLVLPALPDDAPPLTLESDDEALACPELLLQPATARTRSQLIVRSLEV